MLRPSVLTEFGKLGELREDLEIDAVGMLSQDRSTAISDAIRGALGSLDEGRLVQVRRRPADTILEVVTRPLGIIWARSDSVRMKPAASSFRIEATLRSEPSSNAARSGRISDWKSGTVIVQTLSPERRER